MDEQVFTAIIGEPSEDCPLYRLVCMDISAPTKLYMITCDEGWRQSIVCTHMYKHIGEWLLTMLQGRPFPKAG